MTKNLPRGTVGAHIGAMAMLAGVRVPEAVARAEDPMLRPVRFCITASASGSGARETAKPHSASVTRTTWR